ncbi:hypothetical protein Phum_PHUM546020 [Pediculus humanus corporis]|uniref:Essential protein Yae1 N-terminal domain-containing protein n=1 Tax=Pediculus humanus subsp. corporis TaxID=121224 RepID=E0W055_PEDHC|nr:uncharacterized protein Phum_PHUM546020 [Pediculus humanus corporis]EEB19011.1 hypothetical protein Phum_PHUM546020 [Pediculus humanus corporis]
MKNLGFQDGVAKGRDLSLQQGFDVGYSAGFNMGKRLGTVLGKLRCENSLKTTSSQTQIEVGKISKKVCLICSHENSETPVNDTVYPESFEKLVQEQEAFRKKLDNSTDPNLLTIIDIFSK